MPDLDPLELRYWDIGQIRDFVKETWQSVGASGWNLLVPRLRQALIAEKVLNIIFLNQNRLNREAIIELRTAMMAEAQLEP
jgi:hypothetical protein